MLLTLKSARNPHWSNAQGTMIDLLVIFVENEQLVGEIPFTASPEDPEEHGRDVFRRAVAGEFGAIAPYHPPTYTDEQLAAMAAQERDKLLGEAALRIAPLQDAVDIGEASPEEEAKLIEWKRYRVQLNRITLQEGYPRSIVWPTKPA